MAALTKAQYLDWLKKTSPSTHADLGTKYEMAVCECKQAFCKGWITQFTDRYQAKHKAAQEAMVARTSKPATKQPTVKG